jgi:hypothetical protein
MGIGLDKADKEAGLLEPNEVKLKKYLPPSLANFRQTLRQETLDNLGL